VTPTVIYLAFIAASGAGEWRCSYAPNPTACRADIVRKLDFILSAYNVVVTTDEPTTRHLTVIVTDEGPEPWGFKDHVVGAAPSTCGGVPGGVAIVFRCVDNGWVCAARAAHEIGHLTGLEHVAKPVDLMYPAQGPMGWADDPVPTVRGLCRVYQNSHQHLLRKLGPRPRR